ncbi:protein Dok-7-like [Melanotaenia boesemani]|uniref:protein Dok-7-like n=1 Tax=Melanotaenia boesemani TaxID=1250792 RepID=UPI001C057A10|nr:protein Dok-7-like [Melanotaenia boesemani]
MTDTVVAEGQVKFRDGKKWKTRWVALQKPSPVADCLTLLVYKEKKKGKSSGHKERLNVTLEGICGVEPGPGYDGVSYTLSILCLAHSLVLGFNSRDALLAWDARIRYSLGEVHRFSVDVEPGTKLEGGPASLHLCNNLLALSRGLLPVVFGHWKLSALRRYGAVPNGFVFEGGSRCGFWAGVFFLSCSEGDHISFMVDCIVRGVTPSRALHGLPPNRPDPNADPASSEERISQETSELEKRLSMLSQCSLASSTASSYSCSTSVAGDDHSISSSSSDTSYGNRLPFWVEPSARQHLSNETASSSSTLKTLTCSDDRLYAAVMSCPSSVQLHPRGLHDSGRQSSLDSGIGIATGSQSSYSGSYSSCTDSLDMACQGGGEEFGSVVSPAPPAPPPTPPPSPFQPALTSEHSSTNISSSCSSRCASRASRRHSEEYQIPSLIRLWYDTPRSLLRALSPREPIIQGAPHEVSENRVSSGSRGDRQKQTLRKSPKELRAQCQATMQRSHSWGSERAPSVDSEGRSTPRPQPVPRSLDIEETQGHHVLYSRIIPEQWWSARSRCSTHADRSALTGSPLSFTAAAQEKRSDVVDIGSMLKGLRRMLPSSPPSAPPPPPPITVNIHRPTSACALFQSPHGAHGEGFHRDSTVNYVNIHINPLPAAGTELLYTELDLQEHGSVSMSSPCSMRGDNLHIYRPKNKTQKKKVLFKPPLSPQLEEGPIRYAHLNTTAMETAQRVGAKHAQGREDRLAQLENRWPPN